jgi:colanic acid biosynthesis glycosyl transferase WcaI
MKIVFLNRYFYPDHSATSQLLTDLAFHLARVGHPVHVITSRLSYDSASTRLPAEEIIQGVHVIRIWTSSFGRQRLWGRALDYGTFYFSAFVYLIRLVRSGDIIVAKTDPPLISVVAAVAAKLRGALLINWVQDLFPEIALALEVKGISIVCRLLQTLRNASLRAARLNVVLGSLMAQRLLREGLHESKVRVIHNWSDGGAIHPIDRDKNDLRREWNLQDAFIVGYSGNIGRAHEFDTILDAAEKLKSVANIVFLFIGGGAQRDRIEEQARMRDLKNIIFKPYQPRGKLSHSLSVPDVHVVSLQPSLEGLIVPSKFYGIAAAGRPTIFIGSKNGEISHILRKAQCGFSIEIGHAEEASRIIRELADHKETCLSLGRRARALFDQRFDTRHAMEAWKSVIAAMATPISSTH